MADRETYFVQWYNSSLNLWVDLYGTTDRWEALRVLYEWDSRQFRASHRILTVVSHG